VPVAALVIIPPADGDEAPLIALPSPVELINVTDPSCVPGVAGSPLTIGAAPDEPGIVDVIEPVPTIGSDAVVVNVNSVVSTGVTVAAGVTGGAGAGGAIVLGGAGEIIVLEWGVIAADVDARIVSIGAVAVGSTWTSCAVVSALGVDSVARGSVTRSSGTTAPWSIGVAFIVSAGSTADESVAVVSGVSVAVVAAGADAAGFVAGGADGNAPTVLSTISAFANGSAFGFAVAFFFGCGRATYMLLTTGTRTLRR
jgi:hypothetical protein